MLPLLLCCRRTSRLLVVLLLCPRCQTTRRLLPVLPSLLLCIQTDRRRRSLALLPPRRRQRVRRLLSVPLLSRLQRQTDHRLLLASLQLLMCFLPQTGHCLLRALLLLCYRQTSRRRGLVPLLSSLPSLCLQTEMSSMPLALPRSLWPSLPGCQRGSSPPQAWSLQSIQKDCQP